MIRNKIKQAIKKGIESLSEEGVIPKSLKFQEILIEKSRESKFGDYSTNFAFQYGPKIKKNPFELAELLKKKIESQEPRIFEKIECVKGFINFFISPGFLREEIIEILRKKEKYGDLKIGKAKKVNLEFISANPTGPLTLGNARGGFYGDVLANILKTAGYKVIKEYYINNRGSQIEKLGHSILGDKEAVYKGKYIEELRARLLKNKDYSSSPQEIGKKGAKIILKEIIKPSIKKMGIKFDVWFEEESLYQRKKVDKIIKELEKKDLVYEKEGMLWFKSTSFGDDKDRVLMRKEGTKTYFASDIAYLKDKFERGFEKLFFILGADHYGYINRLKASAEVLGFQKEKLIIIIMQLARLFKKGEEIKMSKRLGTYITVDEVIDEIGLDATRFFFLQMSPENHLVFDLDLAKEQSARNPIYYIQYAYVRIGSIFKKAGNPRFIFTDKQRRFQNLKHPSELRLIKQLVQFPEVIEDIAKNYQVHRLTQYAFKTADVFHKFYEDCRVISEDKELTQSRLFLMRAAQIILKKTFDLMGISIPKEM